MKFPNKETVERVRKEYPIGTRVELVQMEDTQAPPIGTLGTIRGVDDTASLLVRWDNGSGLNVVYGEDIVRKVSTKTSEIKTCPRCVAMYGGVPALSRKDNETLICPDCGTREALESIGVGAVEQDSILETIHRSQQGG